MILYLHHISPLTLDIQIKRIVFLPSFVVNQAAKSVFPSSTSIVMYVVVKVLSTEAYYLLHLLHLRMISFFTLLWMYRQENQEVFLLLMKDTLRKPR